MSSSLPILFVVDVREGVAACLAPVLAKLLQPAKVQDGGLRGLLLAGSLGCWAGRPRVASP